AAPGDGLGSQPVSTDHEQGTLSEILESELVSNKRFVETIVSLAVNQKHHVSFSSWSLKIGLKRSSCIVREGILLAFRNHRSNFSAFFVLLGLEHYNAHTHGTKRYSFRSDWLVRPTLFQLNTSSLHLLLPPDVNLLRAEGLVEHLLVLISHGLERESVSIPTHGIGGPPRPRIELVWQNRIEQQMVQ